MGRRPGVALSRVSIGRTALEILDEEGDGAVTVRGIAARLGVKAPSLYNHVRSKDEILDSVTEIIDEELDQSALDHPDWRHGLAGFARSYRDAFSAHPNAVAVIARRAVETHAALSAYDKALDVWQRAGWSAQDSLLIMGALEYLVLGSVLVPFTGGFIRPAAAYAPSYPALSASLSATALDAIDDQSFELGLDLLIVGLDAQLTAGLGPAGRDSQPFRSAW